MMLRALSADSQEEGVLGVVKRKRLRPTDLLAPLEGQVMAALWRSRELTAVELVQRISATREEPLARVTVLTVLRRLEAKGCVAHRDEGNHRFQFRASVPEKDFVTWHGRQRVKALQKRYGTDIVLPGLIDSDPPDPDVLARLREILALYDNDQA